MAEEEERQGCLFWVAKTREMLPPYFRRQELVVRLHGEVRETDGAPFFWASGIFTDVQEIA